MIVNRFSWPIASQSFLFTAYAIILNGLIQTRVASYTTRQELLLSIIPVLAISTCTLIYLGVFRGVRMMANLRRDLRERLKTGCEFRPPFQGTTFTLALGHLAPLILPPLFALAWAAMLFSR